MFKLVFVCHGNICRSPMAEAVMKAIVKEKGMEKHFLIDSRATSREEIIGGMGNPVHPDARRELSLHGIPCPAHRAIQLIRDDYGKYDLFIGMDRVNMLNMARIFGKEDSYKVKKLLDFAGGGDVADPWYTDRFDTAYNDIYRGCEALFAHLVEKGIVE